MITKNICGPYIWYIMHIVSFNYPNSFYKKKINKTNKLYQSFYKHIYYIIPCTYCREHYKIQMEKYPIEFFMKQNLLNEVSEENSKTKNNFLSELIIFYHNNVNALNHKKIYNFNQAKKLYLDKNNNLKINFENIFYLVEILTLCNIHYKMIINILSYLKYILYNFDFFKKIPNYILQSNSKKKFIHNYFIWKNKSSNFCNI